MSAYELEPCLQVPLPENQLLDVVEKAKDWALMNGAALRSKDNFSKDILQVAPFILLPSSLPRHNLKETVQNDRDRQKREFDKSVHLQPILNELTHKVAHDEAFLRDTLAETIKVDDFTRKLFEIYDTVWSDERTQANVSVGLLRSDYMMHSLDDCSFKQVELNTIASSFGGISSHLLPLHSYILKELGQAEKLQNMPENNALSGLCLGMIEAWKLAAKPEAVIMFIIEDVTYNICDQRFHEFEIRRLAPNVKVIRRTLTQLHEQAQLGPNRELLVDGVEVTVIYFRAGYEPGHYHGEKEWEARLRIEQSMAIKCPSIQYHLAGTKKVQQALASREALKRFIEDEASVDAVLSVFTRLYSLDMNEEGEAAVKLALADPEKYVLKPQREGGGNNVYGSDIPTALESMKNNERSAWILMERIFPPVSKGYLIRPGGPSPPPVVELLSELGVFGVVIGTKDKILYNKHVGHMLRTKLATADEGGVIAGVGALDSPYLVDCCK